jgi:gas vesicle protein
MKTVLWLSFVLEKSNRAVLTHVKHVVLALATTAMLITTLSADETFSGDVTVNGTLKAHEVHSSDGVLVSEKRLVAFRQEMVTQAVKEAFDTLRFRSTANEVRAITDQITSNVMQSIEKKLREESVSNTKSESSALKRQISDLENKQRDSERQLSRLEREIEQLRRDLAQRQK